MGRSLGDMEDVDEDELEAELAGIDDELDAELDGLTDDVTPSYIDVPSVSRYQNLRPDPDTALPTASLTSTVFPSYHTRKSHDLMCVCE